VIPYPQWIPKRIANGANVQIETLYFLHALQTLADFVSNRPIMGHQVRINGSQHARSGDDPEVTFSNLSKNALADWPKIMFFLIYLIHSKSKG